MINSETGLKLKCSVNQSLPAHCVCARQFLDSRVWFQWSQQLSELQQKPTSLLEPRKHFFLSPLTPGCLLSAHTGSLFLLLYSMVAKIVRGYSGDWLSVCAVLFSKLQHMLTSCLKDMDCANDNVRWSNYYAEKLWVFTKTSKHQMIVIATHLWSWENRI